MHLTPKVFKWGASRRHFRLIVFVCVLCSPTVPAKHPINFFALQCPEVCLTAKVIKYLPEEIEYIIQNGPIFNLQMNFGGNKDGTARAACKKCGYAGHLTFQCRNFIKVDPSKELVLDVSSTSSDSEDEYVTPLIALRQQETAKEESSKKKKEKKKKQKKQKKSKKKRHSSSDSDSSDADSRKRKRDTSRDKSSSTSKHKRKRRRRNSSDSD